MCIPVDSMLWALVRRVREEGYVVTEADLRALLGSGCSAARVREVFGGERDRQPGRTFGEALDLLDRLLT
jgi:hypothetical protein